jgi:hypothetical protein
MAVVLCDGSPSSLKALDFAAQPRFLLSRLEDEQLILLYGWKDVKDVAQLQQLINSALEQIEKNKYAAGTLNYKIEMVRLGTIAVAPVNVPPQQPAAPPFRCSSKSMVGSSKEDVLAALLANSTAAVSPPPIEEPPSQVIANYLNIRCDHHNIHSIVLGVGNAQTDKKSINFGSVAKEVLAKHHRTHNLFFVKSTASALRLTAPIKYLVLVDPLAVADSSPLISARYALSLCNKERKDRVSILVIANNGVAKTDEEAARKVKHVSATFFELVRQAGMSDEKGTPRGGAEEGDASQTTEQLVNVITLEPAQGNTTPTLSDVPNQLTKQLAHYKADFLVLPPVEQQVVSDFLLQTLLTLTKPHILCPKDGVKA